MGSVNRKGLFITLLVIVFLITFVSARKTTNVQNKKQESLLTEFTKHLSYTSLDSKYTYYSGSDGKVYHRYSTSVISSEYKLIPEADLDTFEILTYEDSLGIHETSYAKDKNYVYLNGKVLLGVDSESFQLLENSLGKDENDYYWGNESFRNILQEADINNLITDKSKAEVIPSGKGTYDHSLIYDAIFLFSYKEDVYKISLNRRPVSDNVTTKFELTKID